MLSELTVVLWKWGRKYDASYVNKMSSMLSRHLHTPYRVICITDDPSGVEVECRPLPVLDHYVMSNINLRRLWIFSAEAGDVLGPRILQLDLDMIITSDITPIAFRSNPFIIWRYLAPTAMGFALNPSVMLFTPSDHLASLWRDFVADPLRQYHAARRARCSGSDQSLITYWFTAPIPDKLTRSVLVPVWTNLDGIYWSRELQSNASSPGALPPDARIISFHGRRDPKQQASKWPWINEHWH